MSQSSTSPRDARPVERADPDQPRPTTPRVPSSRRRRPPLPLPPSAPQREEALAAPAPRSRSGLGRFVLLVVVPAAAVVLGTMWWLSAGRYVSTDNAYVGADKSLITPQVTGPIVAVHVREGQRVEAGAPLFDLDPAPYQTALTLAQGRVAAAKVEFANLQATYASNENQIAMGQKAVELRQNDYDRKLDLVNSHAGTRVDLDTSQAALVQAQQILEFVRSQQESTKIKLGGGPTATIDSFPDYIQAKAGLDDAERNMARTHVVAPIAGVATQVDQIELGRVAPAGQAGVRHRRRPRPVGRRQSEGIRSHLRARRRAGERDDRHVPRARLQGPGLLDRARHRLAVLDPAGAERERQLGEGGAARAVALLLRRRARTPRACAPA